jgi:hypothetical protein
LVEIKSSNVFAFSKTSSGRRFHNIEHERFLLAALGFAAGGQGHDLDRTREESAGQGTFIDADTWQHTH